MHTNSGWWGAWNNHDATIERLVSKDRSVAIAEIEQMNSDRDDPFRWPTPSRTSGGNYTDEDRQLLREKLTKQLMIETYMKHDTTKLNPVAVVWRLGAGGTSQLRRSGGMTDDEQRVEQIRMLFADPALIAAPLAGSHRSASLGQLQAFT